jgi:type I restriction enzyme S subunit
VSFPRYPEYKDSGVEWLRKVPAHWDLARFKHILRERDERSIGGEEELLSVSAYTGVTPRSAIIEAGAQLTRAETLEGYKVCKRNDLVVNIMLAWNRGLGVTVHDGIVSPSYCVFEPNSRVYPRFLDYLVRCDQYLPYFKAHSAGVIDSRLRLYPDVLAGLIAIMPPLNEQRAIVDVLDHETAKIDALVAEQERLIALLKEKRQAVISHAVTKGLNPDAPTKDSGIDWLGSVPAGWTLTPLRYLVQSVGQGWSPQCESYAADWESEYGVLKVGAVNGGIFDPSENKKLPPALEPQTDLAIRAGDLMISRANTRELVGSAAVADDDYPHLLLCDKLYRLRFRRSGQLPKFISRFLATPVIREQIELGASGASASMLNISQSVILDLPAPVPPEDEMLTILDYCARAAEETSELIEQA